MTIIHHQFESIHPFLDGNGRLGRILNILYLVQQDLLSAPVLYLSSYILKHKERYYRLLREVKEEENWLGWCCWLLTGVEVEAQEALIKTRKIKSLMMEYKATIKKNFKFYTHELINAIFSWPCITIDAFSKELNLHRHTATSHLNKLVEAKLLIKTKKGIINYYLNHRLVDILKQRV